MDYSALVGWIVAQLCETLNWPKATVIAETWYYTAVPEDEPNFKEGLLNFLRKLEREGIHVEKFPTRSCLLTCTNCEDRLVCAKCEKNMMRLEEEQVDVALAVKSVWLAMRREVDVVVLISGDGDFVPAVVAVQKEGIPVVIAAPDLGGVSRRLRDAGARELELAPGIRQCMRYPSPTNGEAPATDGTPLAGHGASD